MKKLILLLLFIVGCEQAPTQSQAAAVHLMEQRASVVPYYYVNHDLTYIYDRQHARCFMKLRRGGNGYWGETGITFVGVTTEEECR